MRISETRLDFQKGVPGFKFRPDGATTIRSSRPAPDSGAMAANRSKNEQGPAEDGGGGRPIMDWEPSVGGLRAVSTVEVGEGKQPAAGNVPKQRRDKEEGHWFGVRSTLRDRRMETMESSEALRRALMDAEGGVYRARLIELLEKAVCDVCNHPEKRVLRTVRVAILTFHAVHVLEVPVLVCSR